MQRHVNDAVGVIKAALLFLQNYPSNDVVECKKLAHIIEESKEIIALHDSMPQQEPQTFEKELQNLINRHNLENGSNTPDYILADYVKKCLIVFDATVQTRTNWYGQTMKDLELVRVINLDTEPCAKDCKNVPEVIPGLEFSNIHMQGYKFIVLNVNTENNRLTVQIDPPISHGVHPWTEDWDLQHTKWGFERGEYLKVEEAKPSIDVQIAQKVAKEADALKKRQYDPRGVIGEMKKQAGREIMADIESKTADTLSGYKQTIEYIAAPIWEEFNQTNHALAYLWHNHKQQSQEYKDLQKRANELALEIGKVKKKALKKEASDKMARMVADVMKVTQAFEQATKAVAQYSKASKEAREEMENVHVEITGWDPVASLDENGFMFMSDDAGIKWCCADKGRFLICYWSPADTCWVSEAPTATADQVREAAATILPDNLDVYVRKIRPTN